MDRMDGTPPSSLPSTPESGHSRSATPVKEKEPPQGTTSLHHRKATPPPEEAERQDGDPLLVLLRKQEQRIIEARYKLERADSTPKLSLTKKQLKARRKKNAAGSQETASKQTELVPVTTAKKSEATAKATPPSARMVDLTNPHEFPSLRKAKQLVTPKTAKSIPAAKAQQREVQELLALAARCKEAEQLIQTLAVSDADLSEKERYQYWMSDSLRGLQRQISDLALECGEYIESDPIEGTVSIKKSSDVVLTENARQLYHQSMANMQHFMTTFYALHADSFRCYVVANLDAVLTPDADLKSQKAHQVFESFAKAITYYILALSYISPQSQTIIKKIEVPEETKTALFHQASELIKTVYEFTGNIMICSWQRIQQHQADQSLSPDIIQKNTHHIIDGVFSGFMKELAKTEMHDPLTRCFQFYHPAKNPQEHLKEQCHQLIASRLLGNATLALRAIHTMRDLATPVDGVCPIPPCPPLEELPHSDLLLYQGAFRVAITMFIDLENMVQQTEDLVKRRNMTEHLAVSAESVTLWLTALFPPAHTEWLAESRKMLKMVSTRNNKACEHFESLMAAKVRTARKLAQSLIESSDRRQRHHTEQAQKMAAVMTEIVENDTVSSTDEPARAQLSVAEIAIKDNWQELRDGADSLIAGNHQKARGHFYRVSNCTDQHKTPGQQAWALYGLADMYHQSASDIMGTQCQAAMAFLKNYHAKIRDNISPTSAEGRQFFQKIQSFTQSMQAFSVAIQPVQKQLRELIDLTFSKENDLDKNDDLMESIADLQMDCRDAIQRLGEFSQNLHTICSDRKNWIRGLKLPPKPGGVSPAVNYEKLLQDISELATTLQTLVDSFSQKLANEQQRLSSQNKKPPEATPL